MSMFVAHIAVILEGMAVAAGLISLHYAQQLRAKLIKMASIVLLIFGVGGFVCTFYYASKYYLHGHYEHAYDFQMTMEGSGPQHHFSSSVGD